MSRSLLLLLLGLVAVQAVIRPSSYGGGRHYHNDDCSSEHHHTKKPTTRALPTTRAPPPPPTTSTTPPTTSTTPPTTSTTPPTTSTTPPTTSTTPPTTSTTPPTTSTTPPTTSTTPPTTSTKRPTTTATVLRLCPSTYSFVHRTNSSYNENKGLWCIKVFTTNTSISIKQAADLCAQDNAQLTNYETEAERLKFVAIAQEHIVGELGLSAGSIAVGGARVPECNSMNRTLLDYPPCNDKNTLYSLPESSHTNPAYTWTTWAAGEPNSNFWTYEVEACLQLHVQPSNAEQHGLLNDMFCEYDVAPNAPDSTLYRNYGALCGRSPEIIVMG